MKNKKIRNFLALIVIGLFVGTAISPAVSSLNNIVESNEKNDI